MTGSQADKLIRDCKANFPLFANIDTVGTTGLWLKTFTNTPDDVMETAVRLCLLECRSFPTVADIKRAIDEIRRDVNAQPTGRLLGKRSRLMPEAAKKVCQIVHDGQAQEYLESADYEELYDWAREYFPDISLDTVKRCSNEVQYHLDEIKRCIGCQWKDGNCHNSGYYPEMVMNPLGYIEIEMKMCGKKAERCGTNRRQSA